MNERRTTIAFVWTRGTTFSEVNPYDFTDVAHWETREFIRLRALERARNLIGLDDALELADVVDDIWRILPAARRKQLANPKQFAPFVTKIIMNTLARALERLGQTVPLDGDYDEGQVEVIDPEALSDMRIPQQRDLELTEIREKTSEALASLSERQRAIVLLKHEEDMSQKEIAALLGISVKTVDIHLGRGVRRLRILLKPLYDSLGDDRRRTYLRSPQE